MLSPTSNLQLQEHDVQNSSVKTLIPVSVWGPPSPSLIVTSLPCSNAAKTRKPLKFAGVPQTRQQISAVTGPKFTILRGHVGDISLLNSFFPIVDMCLGCEDIARQRCAMVPRWRLFGDFLGPVFPASRAQHVSDLHYKFTLGPRHVTKYGRHPIYGC